jgi:hypothetical protein
MIYIFLKSYQKFISSFRINNFNVLIENLGISKLLARISSILFRSGLNYILIQRTVMVFDIYF